MNGIPIPDRVKNLTGQRFGRLEVIAYAGIDKRGQATWLCRCTGADCDSRQTTVVGAQLRIGHTKSCGCLRREASLKHGLSGHPLYNVWYQMVARCTNPRDKGYAEYGGRGITVCDAWLQSCEVFYREMSPGYAPGLQMDRRDNDGPYSLSNCRWVTPSHNNRNRRSTRVVEFAGQSRCVTEWAELLNLTRHALSARLNGGWTIERALTQGVDPERLAELGLAQ